MGSTRVGPSWAKMMTPTNVAECVRSYAWHRGRRSASTCRCWRRRLRGRRCERSGATAPPVRCRIVREGECPRRRRRPRSPLWRWSPRRPRTQTQIQVPIPPQVGKSRTSAASAHRTGGLQSVLMGQGPAAEQMDPQGMSNAEPTTAHPLIGPRAGLLGVRDPSNPSGGPPSGRPAALAAAGPVTAVQTREGRDVVTRPIGLTMVSSSLALPDMAQPLRCTRP